MQTDSLNNRETVRQNFEWQTDKKIGQAYRQKYGQRKTKNYVNTDKWIDKNMNKQEDKKWIAIQIKNIDKWTNGRQ